MMVKNKKYQGIVINNSFLNLFENAIYYKQMVFVVEHCFYETNMVF